MLETWVIKARQGLAGFRWKRFRWMRILPPGAWIVLAVAGLVGGRMVWLRASVPAHLKEITAAFGSIGVFQNLSVLRSPARFNHDFSQFTYVTPTDTRGLGVFLCDTATGKKRLVHAQIDGPGPWHDDYDLQVWPWSPDDRSFVYSGNQQLFIYDVQTGKSASIDLRTKVTSLTWLNPATILFLGNEGKLHELDRQPDGMWTSRKVVLGEFVLRSVGSDAAAVASETAPGGGATNAMDGDETTSWFSGKSAGPVWLQYRFNVTAWAVTRYTITSSSADANADPRDWQLLGSNDGTNWTALDCRSNETFTARGQTKQYEFANETPYWFYRLKVTGTAGGSGSGARLAEFELFSQDTPEVVSANPEDSPTNGAWWAFEGSGDAQWYNLIRPTPAWLQVQFGGGAGVALSEYRLTSGNDAPERDPRDWEFQASNDGATWTTLDRQTGGSFESRQQTKSYSFQNSTPYRFYRLYITANQQASPDGVQLSEADLDSRKWLGSIKNSDVGLVRRNTDAIVTASSTDVMPGAGADKVHDENETASRFSGKSKGRVWLQYEFTQTAWAITQYKLINSSANSVADPRDWQLLASNDGTNWTMLDRQTNQVFVSRRQAKRYPLRNQKLYRFYRLNITANAGGNDSGVRLAEFQLWSDDTPAVAAASAEKASVESAAKAFDGRTDTKWFNDNAGATGWLQYEFGGGEAPVLTQYALSSANDVPERDPKDWQLQASNDGQTWTDLDVEHNQRFGSRFQTKFYSFANQMPYRFYRLNITANRGEGGLQLSEFNLGTTRSGRTGKIANPFANAFSLTTLDDRTIAWGQSGCVWSMSLGSGFPRLLLDVPAALPAKTTLRSLGYSRETGQFLLGTTNGTGGSLWVFNPSAGAGTNTVQILQDSLLGDAQWVGPGEFVYAGAGHGGRELFVADLTGKPPVPLVQFQNIGWFKAAPDGKKVFVWGVVSNEPGSGVWEYDTDSKKLSPVLPYAQMPSVFAREIKSSTGLLKLPDGRTITCTIFTPPNFDRHKKYPLVLGDTYVPDPVHGQYLQAGMAAGGAFVVFVNRPLWNTDIEQWEENVRAVFDILKQDPCINTKRVYLVGASGETQYMSQCLEKTPGLWKGAILLNPGALPDFSKAPRFQSRPKIFISAGSEEHEEDHLKQYQQDALQSGALVEYLIAPTETHRFVGTAAKLARLQAINHFIFEE
jgi:hypothetical protein